MSLQKQKRHSKTSRIVEESVPETQQSVSSSQIASQISVNLHQPNKDRYQLRRNYRALIDETHGIVINLYC